MQVVDLVEECTSSWRAEAGGHVSHLLDGLAGGDGRRIDLPGQHADLKDGKQGLSYRTYIGYPRCGLIHDAVATNAGRILAGTGLEHLVMKEPIGTITLDPGNTDLRMPQASYRYFKPSAAYDMKYMRIDTGQFVHALQHSIPHSTSEVRAVLQVTATSPSQLNDLCRHSHSKSKGACYRTKPEME